MASDASSVLGAVREHAVRQIAADARSVDRDRAFPEEGLRALAATGGFGLVVPESAGGAGGSLEALVDACESVGAACASTGMVFLMHSVTSATIAAGGGARADGYLRSLARGDALGTLAFSERGTGAHFYAPELRASRSNGTVHISGRKTFVTSGGHADLYLVLVQGESEGLDCYAVERENGGLGFDGGWSGLGMAGNESIAMELDVDVSEEARIGAAGKGQELVFDVVAPFFLLGLAAVNVGIARAASEAAIEHARDRRYPDGSSLAEIQFIQHELARMDLRVRSARLVVTAAARLGEAADPSALVAIMEAKIAATEAAVEVTQLALEVCGGQGYTRALPIERHLRDARAGTVMAPTNAVLKSWVGKALAGLPVP
ncbi:MAG: acyl-CoA dehydrogenase family protein [Gaiellaceae bacterium]